MRYAGQKNPPAQYTKTRVLRTVVSGRIVIKPSEFRLRRLLKIFSGAPLSLVPLPQTNSPGFIFLQADF
jgi:hypothetical protein